MKPQPKYTVKSLIQALKKLDPTLPVMMSQDPEGNGFHPFYEMGVYKYDLNDHEIRDEDDTETTTKALVLWP